MPPDETSGASASSTRSPFQIARMTPAALKASMTFAFAEARNAGPSMAQSRPLAAAVMETFASLFAGMAARNAARKWGKACAICGSRTGHSSRSTRSWLRAAL
jgi:hypothetical protein